MRKFFKKKTDFVLLLVNQCDIAIQSLVYFKKYIDTKVEEFADKVIECEREGDKARVNFIKELNKNIVTSIDKQSFFNFSGITLVARKDLFTLSRLIDEFIDYVKTSVDEIREYEIIPNSQMRLMTEVLLEMARLMKDSIINIQKDRTASRDFAIAAKKLENEVASICVSSIKELLNSGKDFIEIMKYRELYRHLNQTADIGDNAMDELLNILVAI